MRASIDARAKGRPDAALPAPGLMASASGSASRPLRRAASRGWVMAGTVVLVVAYLWGYALDVEAPGNNPRFPLGWWGGWDQSKYLDSALSLAAGDLHAVHHWYPLGYAFLGAPFAMLLPPGHLYLLADLLCLLGTYAGFLLFARRVGTAAPAAVLLFLLGTITCPDVLVAWVKPWNTSLSAMLIWWLLALTAQLLQPAAARYLARRRCGVALIGMIVAAIPITRPTDLLVVASWAAFVTATSLLRRRAVGDDPFWLAFGACLVLLPFARVYLHIYGLHPSQYMLQSRMLGFRLDGLGWKAYTLLIDPLPWFPYGAGMLEAMPWLAAGAAGILVLPMLHGEARALLALLTLAVVPYVALFLSYVDLLPTGLWRYGNIHYFKWTLPGFALLGFVALRELATGPRRLRVAGCFALTALLLCLRLTAVPAGAAQPARMVQLPGEATGFDPAYFGSMAIRDRGGFERNIVDFRLMPDGQGLRLLALARPLRGMLTILSGDPRTRPGTVPPVRWRGRLGLGWPCWLPPYACDALPPR